MPVFPPLVISEGGEADEGTTGQRNLPTLTIGVGLCRLSGNSTVGTHHRFHILSLMARLVPPSNGRCWGLLLPLPLFGSLPPCCVSALTSNPCHMVAVPAFDPTTFLSSLTGLFAGEFMSSAPVVRGLASQAGACSALLGV